MPGLKTAEIDGRLEDAGIDKVYVYCVVREWDSNHMPTHPNASTEARVLPPPGRMTAR